MAKSAATWSPRILGLTGAIGCGKTTVGDILLRCGALERIDADMVVHELMWPGTAVTAAIADAFGPEVLRKDGSVDRPALASRVFGDARALQDLEAITHPAVRSVIRQHLERRRGEQGVVIVDAVKLLQSDLLPLCDTVWVVRCSAGEQMRRLVERRGMAPDAAAARLAAQPSFDHPLVGTVIDNSGSRSELQTRVESAWYEYIAGYLPVVITE